MAAIGDANGRHSAVAFLSRPWRCWKAGNRLSGSRLTSMNETACSKRKRVLRAGPRAGRSSGNPGNFSATPGTSSVPCSCRGGRHGSAGRRSEHRCGAVDGSPGWSALTSSGSLRPLPAASRYWRTAINFGGFGAGPLISQLRRRNAGPTPLNVPYLQVIMTHVRQCHRGTAMPVP